MHALLLDADSGAKVADMSSRDFDWTGHVFPTTDRILSWGRDKQSKAVRFQVHDSKTGALMNSFEVNSDLIKPQPFPLHDDHSLHVHSPVLPAGLRECRSQSQKPMTHTLILAQAKNSSDPPIALAVCKSEVRQQSIGASNIMRWDPSGHYGQKHPLLRLDSRSAINVGEVGGHVAFTGPISTAKNDLSDADCRTLAITGRGRIRSLRLETGSSSFLQGHRLLYVLGNDRVIVSGSPEHPDNHAYLYDSLNGNLLIDLGEYDTASRISVSPDGTNVATANKDTLRIWDTQTCEITKTLPFAAARVAYFFRTSGDRFVNWHDTSELVGHCLHDASDGERIASMPTDSQFVTSSPDGEHLASYKRQPSGHENKDNEINIWHLADGSLCRTIGHPYPSFVSFSAGNLIAIGGRGRFGFEGEIIEGGPTLIYRPHEEEPLFKLPPPPSTSSMKSSVSSFSRSGRYFVTSQSKAIYLADTKTGKVGHLTEAVDEGNVNPFYYRLSCVGYDAEESRLFTGHEDGFIRAWSTSSHTHLGTLNLRQKGAGFVRAFRSGSTLVTDDWFSPVRIWDSTDLSLRATYVDYDDDNWLTFEPSGYYIGTQKAGEWATIHVDGRMLPLECYAAILNRPDLVEASLAGKKNPKPYLPDPPTIEVYSPRKTYTEVNDRSITIEGVGRDRAGLKGVRILQDSMEVTGGIQLDWEPGKREVSFKKEIQIPADQDEMQVRIQSINRSDILSRPRSLKIRYVPKQRNLYLLAMGVADYDDDKLDLNCSVQDVNDLVAVLQEQEGLLYDKVYVESATDAEVTSAKIKQLRHTFLRKAQPDDTILIFVAGHGTRTEDGEYYFLTSGATGESPFEGIERYLLESMVTWEKLHAKRRVLLIDTCHAGQGVEGARADVRGAQVIYTPEEVEAFPKDADEGVYILAATSEQALAREQEGNGIFTRAVLDALEGAADSNGDGLVQVEELRSFVEEQVHERTGGRQRPTMPKVEGGENFPLARVKE
jgi:hypothetical protein